MNTIYRIVWNAATGKWVVASELAKGRKKKSATKVALLALALAGFGAPVAFATDTDSQQKTEETDQDQNNIITPFFADGGGADSGFAANVAIGQGAVTQQNNSVAIGSNAITSQAFSTAIGYDAQAQSRTSTAIGGSSRALGNPGSTAIGYQTTADSGTSAGAWSGTAIGTHAYALGDGATAFGDSASAKADRAAAFGRNANADQIDGTAFGASTSIQAEGGTAVGSGASVAAGAINGVAIGFGSTADRGNAVSVGTTAAGGQRQIINVAAGTAETDAVNLSQLKTTAADVAEHLGGGASVNPDGSINAPTYEVGGTNVYNVGDAISNLDGRVTKNEGDIVDLQNNVSAATRYFKADGLNDGSDDAVASGSRAVAMGASSAATSDQSIAIGFGAKANTNEGTIAIGANSRATGENSVALGSSSIADRDNVVSVGMGPSIGNGTRQIINVTNGTENTDAVNVQQLKPAIAALGGGATFNANGTVTGPQYTVADLGNGGSKTVNNVGDALGQLNANTTNLNGRVTTNEGDIVDIRNQLGSGSIGLVQQAGASAAVTVAAATGGSIVDFKGTDGARQLKGVSKGEDATDAVNVAQLRDELASASAGDTRYFKANGANDGTDDAIATGDKAVAIGANAKGSGASAVALGDGAEAMFANSVAVGAGALATYTNAVAIGTGASANSTTAVAVGATAKATNINDTAIGAGAQARVNSTALGQGSLALNGSISVGQGAQAMGNNSITIGKGALILPPAANSIAMGSGARATAANAIALGAGSVADRTNTVSVGSAGSERQIVNVADGTEDTDGVNVRQLKSAGLVGDDGSLMDAVVYDAGSSRSSITLGGVAGTTITNVMAGLVAPGSMDAINGSQLWGVQDQINKLGDRVTTVENGGGSSPVPVDPINPGNGSPHFASNGDANKPATATGGSSVAAGEGAAASGNNSTAIGAGSSATGNNSVAIGAGSVADSDNTVSVGSVGNERRVSNVAAGTQRTDAANVGQLQDAMSNLQDWTQGQVNGLSKKVDNVQRQANRGIAASAALVNNMPYLPGKVTLNAGVAAYRGQSALGVGVSRWSDNGRFNVNAGISAAQGDAPIFRVGVGVVLGD